MKFFEWANEQIRKMKWYDISFVKLASAAFALCIAKVWPPVFSLTWHGYLIIALAASIPPMKKMLIN